MTRFTFKRVLTLGLILGMTVLLVGRPAMVDAQANNPNAYGSDPSAPNNAVFVTAAGNVGVGTQDPGSRLMARTDAGGTTNNILSFATYADTGKGSHFGIDTVNRMMYWRMSDAYDYGWQFQNRDGAPHMIIDNKSNVIIGGNIGIGTLTPSRKLQILANTGGKTNDIIFFGTSADEGKHSMFGVDTENRMMYWRLQDAYDYGWQFQNRDGAPHMIIDNKSNVIIGGNIGIGTLTPSRKLQILANTGGKTNDIIFFGTSADEGKHSMFGVDTENRMMYWRLQDAYDYGWQFQNRDGAPHMIIDNKSNVIIGGNLDINGTTSTKVLQITGGSDLAEPFEIADAADIQPGMVVAIDPDNPGQLRLATAAYDRTVAGVVSGAGGINPGLVMQQEGSLVAGSHPVALTGRVYVYADASNGAIIPGDLLTTSATPGHAMKVTDYDRAQGAILGKAMSKLAEGTGLVLVLVTLQ